jgi:hypothetical protein
MGEEPIFVVPEIRKSSEAIFHRDVAPGFRYVAMDKSLYPESPIYIMARRVKHVPENQREYIDWHVHSVDSVYLFIGDGDGMRGMYGVVRYGEKEKNIESPMTVFIPRGIRHCYKLNRGSGLYISVLLSGDYNECTFDRMGGEGQQCNKTADEDPE